MSKEHHRCGAAHRLFSSGPKRTWAEIERLLAESERGDDLPRERSSGEEDRLPLVRGEVLLLTMNRRRIFGIAARPYAKYPANHLHNDVADHLGLLRVEDVARRSMKVDAKISRIDRGMVGALPRIRWLEPR